MIITLRLGSKSEGGTGKREGEGASAEVSRSLDVLAESEQERAGGTGARINISGRAIRAGRREIIYSPRAPIDASTCEIMDESSGRRVASYGDSTEVISVEAARTKGLGVEMGRT